MRVIILSLLILCLCACGGSNDSSKPTPPAQQTNLSKNQPPTLTISGDNKVNSSGSLQLSTKIEDPEGDDISLAWTSSVNGVSFTNSSKKGVIVYFPSVKEDTSVTLTLSAEDSSKNKAVKSFDVTIIAVPLDVSIDLQSEYQFVSNKEISITAKYSSNEEIKEVDWQLTTLVVDDMNIATNTINDSGESTVSFMAPIVSSTQEYELVFLLKTAQGEERVTTTLRILPDDQPYLSINLEAAFSVDELNKILITPEIDASHSITSYEWLWKSKSLGELENSKTKQVSIKANSVNDDDSAKLVLKVTMAGDITQEIETTIKVKNVVDSQNVYLSINRNYATTGQELNVTVNNINTDDISEVNWSVNNDDVIDITKSNSELSFIAPKIESGHFTSFISYKVTFKNGDTKEKQIYYNLLSENLAKIWLNIIEPDITPQLYKNETLKFSAKIKDTTGILDNISIEDQEYNYVDLKVKNVIRDGNMLHFELLVEELSRDYTFFLKLLMKAGTVTKEVLVEVKANKSRLKLIPGTRKNYLLGSDFYVFASTSDFYNKDNYELSWNTRHSYFTVENISNGVALIKSNGSRPGYKKFDVTSTDKDDITVSSSTWHKYRTRFQIRGAGYNCSFQATQFTCNGITSEDIKREDIKPILRQAFTIGEYVCLLNTHNDVECLGQGPQSILDVPELDDVALIYPVSEQDMCAKSTSSKWQCWGENQQYLNTLLGESLTIDSLMANDNATCLVKNGYLECYDKASNLLFEDKTDFVTELTPSTSSLCYTTENGSYRKCPDILQAN